MTFQHSLMALAGRWVTVTSVGDNTFFTQEGCIERMWRGKLALGRDCVTLVDPLGRVSLIRSEMIIGIRTLDHEDEWEAEYLEHLMAQAPSRDTPPDEESGPSRHSLIAA
jgi:hypothetical protein